MMMNKKSVVLSGWFLLMMLLLGACASEGPDVEAPQVNLDVRGEETYTVGEDVIRIHLTATDPQGLDLSFATIDPPSRATFQTFANSAVFTWDPITSDVTTGEPRRLVFAVANSRGVTTERVVLVTIQPGNTVPRFLNSTSELYNPATGAPMEIQVRVRDDDSPQVILSMPSERAPQGASFEQVDDFEGRFSWMPSPVQLQQRMHTVVFVADDGDNDLVEQKVTIVIQSQDGGSGPGPGPGPGPGEPTLACEDVEGIEHQPLGAQRGAQGYLVEGRIVDQSHSWQEAVVYYTEDDPLGEARYSAVALDLQGDLFSGYIPNPLLEAGESVVISYTICAFGEGEDAVFCSPWDFLFRFVAYSPDEDKCRDDGLDYSSPGKAGEISLSNWEQYRVCEGLPKYHQRELESGESMDVVVAFTPGVLPDVEVTMNASTAAMEVYECLGFMYGEVQGPGTVQVRVEAPDGIYHLTGFGEAPQCPGQEYEPNDRPSQATLIASDFAIFEEMAICTREDIDIFALELVRGDEFYAWLGFSHAQGDLDMTLFAPSEVTEVVSGGFGVAQGWSTSDNESITYTAEESGFYYLKVETSSEPNTYELAVERSCVVDGPYAGNHDQILSEFLELGAHEGLKLCENQSAWFGFEHQGSIQGYWLGEVAVSYGSISAVEVKLFDDWGNQIGVGNLSGGFVDFSYEPQPGEVVYVEVRSNQPTIFNLTVLDFL